MLIRKTVIAAILSTAAVPALYITATPAAANVQHALDNPYVASARSHFEKGRFREASIELKNALRQDPNNADARYMLGRILFEQGDLSGAAKELGRAHDLAPSDDTAIWLAETRMQMGDPAGALALVENDGATVDGTIRRLTVKAAAETMLKRFDDAEASYRRSLEIDPRRVEGHFGLAQVFVGKKDYRAAADKLDEIVIGKPDFSPGWMLRGEVALAKGNKQAAFVAFDKAVALSPETAPPLIARARANLASGDLERARVDTDAVEKIAPNAPITHYLKAAVAFAEGDVDRANKSFTHLQRSFDNFPPAVLLGALIKQQRGDHNQADALLTRYIAMEPGNLEARRALASVRLSAGQPRNAIDMLRSVLRVAPNDPASLRQMASAYLTLDQYEEAEATFRKLTEIGAERDIREAEMALQLLNPPAATDDPVFAELSVRRKLLKAVDRSSNGDAKAAKALLDTMDVGESATVLALRGGVAAQLGDADAARGFLDRALAIEPELTSAIATYEQLDQREGTADRILPRMMRLLEMRPLSELLTLGIAQRMGMEGDRAGATEFLARRVGIAPNSVPISRALISAYMVQEDFAAAADEAERLAGIAGGDPAALGFAANALIDAKAPDRAVRVAETIRAAAPNSHRAATLLAEAQAQAGQIDEARRTLQDATKQFPDAVGAVASLVKFEVAQRNPEAVKKATSALAKRDPNAAARLNAQALSEMGQPGLAVMALEEAFAKRPDSRLAVDLFSARRRAGRDDAAFADLSKWIDSHRDDRAALMTYATGLLEVGRHGEAAKAYEAYLAMEPNNPVALNNYAWLRHQNQRPDALDYAKRAYDAASGSPEIADTYGWMLVTYGKLKEGLALLQTAKEAAPNSPDIHYHFAYALTKAGRKDEAKQVLVNVLGTDRSFEKRAEAEQLMQQLGG